MVYKKAKEIHFVDSSIFLSIIKNDENRRKSTRYLALIRQNIYEGLISPLVIGEVAIILKQEIKDESEFYKAICDFRGLLGPFHLFIPKIPSYLENLNKIKHIEKRSSSTDTRIIAESIVSSAKRLITIDKKYNSKSVNNIIDIVDISKVPINELHRL